MGKLSKSERAELERKLREDDQADEDTSEYEVGFPDGGYIRGQWDRVRAAAAARGFKLEDEPPAEETDVPRTGEDDEQPGPRRFGGRRVG